ncbi:MAG: glycosyltransferase family 9 protein, partial [Candidatus Thorarchaeota archaeon]
ISGFWKCKSYPHWVELIEILKNLYNCSIFLVGGNDDKQWGREIEKQTECYNMIGKLNILETAGLIKQCDLVISTDTSVFHIADALEVDGIVLFGPTLISKNGPLNNTIIPIRSPLECAPCQDSVLMNTCLDTSLCMNAIDVGMIIATVRKILA